MRVILAAGGSGGHIFPSVALAGELEKAGACDCFFVSSKRRLDRRILERRGHRSFFLSVNPMPFGLRPIRWFIFVLKLAKDTVTSLALLLRIKPDVVVGFGGYSSGSIVKCAGLLDIPVLIHEQNLLPGRANRILSGIAERVAVSFKETAEYLPDIPGRVFFSGNPLRSEILSNDKTKNGKAKAADHLELPLTRRTVLIMGGSQGSTFLNSVASNAARMINEKEKSGIQFIHLTGKDDYDRVSRFYAENRISGKVFSFLDRIDYAYLLSDLAISRAGGAAIFELAFYSRPMILVPYPDPKNNQRFNAVYFSRKGAAVVKEENELSAAFLAREVTNILADQKRWNEMSVAASRLAVPEAGKRLAEAVIALAK